jgi:hypothetical protein
VEYEIIPKPYNKISKIKINRVNTSFKNDGTVVLSKALQ